MLLHQSLHQAETYEYSSKSHVCNKSITRRQFQEVIILLRWGGVGDMTFETPRSYQIPHNFFTKCLIFCSTRAPHKEDGCKCHMFSAFITAVFYNINSGYSTLSNLLGWSGSLATKRKLGIVDCGSASLWVQTVVHAKKRRPRLTNILHRGYTTFLSQPCRKMLV